MSSCPTERPRQTPSHATDGCLSHPLVSAVIPAYNCARFIGEALESVFAQEYPALEVIVVDDGSTDDTREKVMRYGGRVSLVVQPNSGAAAARNEGIRRSRGKYVAFLDGDDFWLPGKLRHQVDHLERHPNIALCCAGWHVLHPTSSGDYHIAPASAADEVHVNPKCSGWMYCELLLDCVVWTSTVLIRRELCDRIGGFDEALRRGQDYDYWLRASRLTRIDQLDAPLAVYRMGQAGMTAKAPDTNWELMVIRRALQKWGCAGPDGSTVARSRVRNRLAGLNYNFGYRQFSNGRYGVARRAFVAAIRERPAHIKTLLYLIASSFRELYGGAKNDALARP